jgi:hypothetical protein
MSFFYLMEFLVRATYVLYIPVDESDMRQCFSVFLFLLCTCFVYELQNITISMACEWPIIDKPHILL